MPTTEPCYVVEARYAQGAAERREPFRAGHLARLARLHEEGALVFAGAFEDLSASLVVLAVKTEEAAAAIVESDVYWKNRVWTEYSIRKLNRLAF